MRTQPIVLASAIWLLVLSLVCLFAPAQVAAQFGISVPDQATVPVQILGATFLGSDSSIGSLDVRPWVESMVGLWLSQTLRTIAVARSSSLALSRMASLWFPCL